MALQGKTWPKMADFGLMGTSNMVHSAPYGQQRPAMASNGAPQVEFAAELRYYYPSLEISVVSSSEGCVPSMPKGAQDYIQRYFDQHNITKLVSAGHEEQI